MHPRQPPLAPPLDEIFAAAVADAGYAHDDAILFTFDAAQSETKFRGMFFRRGIDATDDKIPELAPLLDEMNRPDVRDAIRIVMFTGGRSEEGAAAISRHELEHGRQFDNLNGDLEGLYGLCEDVLYERVGTLPGGSLLYTLMPIEMDANAAGAMFALDRYGPDRIRGRLEADPPDPDAAALRSLIGPEPIETLPERMVAFMIANRGLCERYAAEHGNGLTFRQILESHWPGAGPVWRELVENDGLSLPR